MKQGTLISVAVVAIVLVLGSSMLVVAHIAAGFVHTAEQVVEETPADYFNIVLRPGQELDAVRNLLQSVQTIERFSFSRAQSAIFGGMTHRGTPQGDLIIHAVQIICTDPEFFAIRHLRLAEGRYFDAGDDGQYVTVIGARAAERHGLSIGSTVSHPFMRTRYVVIGILHPIEAELWDGTTPSPHIPLGAPADDSIEANDINFIFFVPFNSIPTAVETENLRATTIAVLADNLNERVLWASVRQGEVLSAVGEDIRRRIEKATGWFAPLTLGTPVRLMHTYIKQQTGGTLYVSLAVAVLVALLNICGLIMMQTFLRAKEIGIRRACGASRGDILREFLSYYGLLSSIGGILALSVSLLLVPVLRSLGIAAVVHTTNTVLITLFAMLAGPLCSLIPASMAGKMSPVDSIADRHAWGVYRRKVDLRQVFIALGFGASIGAVFFVSSLGASSVSDIDQYMRAAGAHTVAVKEPPLGSIPTLPQLTFRHYEELRGPSIEQYGDSAWLERLDARIGTEKANIRSANVFATHGDLTQVLGFSLLSGRWHTRSREVVLGAEVARELFGGETSVGREVLLGYRAVPFTVVGLLAPRPARLSDLDADRDFSVFIVAEDSPMVAHYSSYTPKIYVRARDEAAVPMLLKALRANLLQVDLSAEHFVIEQVLGPLIEARALRFSYYLGLLAITIVSVFVSAAGIAMLALVQTKELSRHIAIRRACGETRRETTASVLREILWVLVVAAAVGTLISYGLYRYAVVLQGFPAVSGVTWLLVAIATSSAVAALAAYLPVRHTLNQAPANLL